ncbi:MAG: DegQ family serine endoprotease [Sedimentisphaerales bacterium]|nr:DegQ family serine endoprotease [Sedimentisphaerales bacterium]
MQIECFSRKKTIISYIIILVVLFQFVFSPIRVLADSEESIATLRQMGKAFASIADKASPAVVGVKSQKTITRQYRQSPFGDQNVDPFGDDFYEFFFGPRRRQQQRRYQEPSTAQGSGFIISADGYILTNNHVVEGAEKIEVELTDGRTFSAEIKGTELESDVAVIKIDANNLPFLELANSDALEVGEWVLAIGNPLGLSHTVTAGIVSAKGRAGFGLADLENFIQTDAAINFGNSGGPLINLDGKVVGMNTAIAGSTGNIGIGFAIPINMARYAYEQILESGTVERGLLGVKPQDLNPDNAEIFGLKDTKGVLIPYIYEGSAADKAGLTYNDVILEVNGQPTESAVDLQTKISMLKPGTKVELTIWRDGKRKKVDVVLGKRSSMDQIASNLPTETAKVLGFTVENLTDEIKESFGYEDQTGVVVKEIDPSSQAALNGMRQGTLIKEVNKRPVRNVREFNQAIEAAKKQGLGRVMLRVTIEGTPYFVFLNLN